MYRGFEDKEDIAGTFAISPAEREQLNSFNILLATYDRDGYVGWALVIYEAPDGSIYEVHGSHCSCYGLEKQWEPELTSWESLSIRPNEDIKEVVKRFGKT